MTGTLAWTVSRLPGERIDQAYPLLQAADRSMTLAEWRHTAARHLATPGREGGIVSVMRGGYIFGLFCYHLENAASGATLRVHDLCAFDLVDSRLTEAMIQRTVTEMARQLGATRIDAELGPCLTLRQEEAFLVEAVRALIAQP